MPGPDKVLLPLGRLDILEIIGFIEFAILASGGVASGGAALFALADRLFAETGEIERDRWGPARWR